MIYYVSMISKRDIKKLKPFKKKHRGLKIFLIVLCVILVLPIAFVFGAFYDPTTKKVSDTEVHYENIVSEAFYKGISGLNQSNPTIGFTINEEMIDGILMAACDKINQKQWIPKMYCYVNDNNYTFVMDAQASFFKTRALIHTNLDKQDNTLVFKITGITLGRLPLPLDLVTSILGNFLNDETLNNAFSQSGFHIESHLKEAKLTYSREQFRIDVGNYLSNLGGNSAYLDILLNTFDNPQVLSTDYKDGVSVNINLAELTKPVKTKEAPINFQKLEDHRKEVEKLLNEKGLEEAGAPKVFTFLLRGNRSSEEIIKYIVDNPDVKTALLSYIGSGITDLKEYPGSFINESSKTFNEYCDSGKLEQEQVFTFDTLTSTLSFMIPSNLLNQVLAYKLENIIGATIPVTFKENNTWGFQYIVIDNVYTGFTRDDSDEKNHQFDIYISLNIGGVRTVLVITADNIGFEVATEPDKLGHLKFKVEGIHFGSIDITSMKDSLADLIPSSGVFSYNKEKSQFEVSIDELVGGIQGITKEIMIKIHDYFKDGTPVPTSKIVKDDEYNTFALTYNLTPQP